MPEDPFSESQRIVISAEDLASETAGNTSSNTQSNPHVVVPPPTQQQSLNPPPPPPPPPPPQTFGAQPFTSTSPQGSSLPGLGSQMGAPYTAPSGFGVGTGMTWNQFLAKLSSNSIISGVVSGALGGFIGWVFSEIFFSPDSFAYYSPTAAGRDAKAGIWVMIFGVFLGFVLMGWEGFTSQATQKLFRDGGIGAGIGLAAGFVGGFLAQAIYAALVVEPTGFFGSPPPVDILIRGLGWAVLGALVGLGIGIPKGGRAVVNGLLGGAAGGFLAGAVFQIIGSNGATSSVGLRCVGLTLTGAGIGVGVGLVTRVRRDAWLVFEAGPMRGKEFILQSAQTRVGGDYRCDVVLVKDAAVAPVHALFTKYGNGVVGIAPQSNAPLLVNGTPTGNGQLRSGDSITIGSSSIRFTQRVAAAMPGY